MLRVKNSERISLGAHDAAVEEVLWQADGAVNRLSHELHARPQALLPALGPILASHLSKRMYHSGAYCKLQRK